MTTAAARSPRTYQVRTYGCQMNVHDSERISGLLEQAGYVRAPEDDDHPDVVELHRRASQVDNRISLSTVYRTVKLLETAGIIERLEFRDSRARYEQAAREHHDHLINLETGDVIEFRFNVSK